MANSKSIDEIFGLLFRAHPWHGVSTGDEAPHMVNAYIEIVPTDTVKYELDKISGHLKIDRPQRFSSMCPTLYGFIPQTLCGKKVAEFCGERLGNKSIEGDGDAMDICILTERPIFHGDVFVQARPIGGLRMIDRQEADDKIIAVLDSDAVYGGIKNISECPPSLIERLKHYFLSYKQAPGEAPACVEIAAIYDRDEAHIIVERSISDYQTSYEDLHKRFIQLKHVLKLEG